MLFSNYEIMQKNSKDTFKEFNNNVRSWTPTAVADLVEVARLDWLDDLTRVLDMWKEMATSNMSEGELLLAYTTLGALVEGWLKLFYCVYYNDYQNDANAPRDRKMNLIVPPNDLQFEKLKIFSRSILWAKGDLLDLWVDKIQYRRNAIHAFNNRNIGTKNEYLSDIDTYCFFVNEIVTRLPEKP